MVDDRVVLRPSLDSSSAADERRGWKYRSAIFHAKIARFRDNTHAEP